MRPQITPLEVVRKLAYLSELEIIQYVYDTRLFKGRGWVCWVCNKRASRGVRMHWAFRKNKGTSPDIVMWDTAACKELLERNKVLV